MVRRKLRWIIVGFVIFALAFGLAGQALAGGQQGGPLQRMIVFTNGDPAVNEAAKEVVAEHSGFVLVDKPAGISGLVVAIPEHAVGPLVGIDGVKAVEPDLVVSAVKGPPEGKGPKDPYDHPDEVLPWGVDRIDADLVWDTDGDLVTDLGANTGEGIAVAIIDTGIDKEHPDLIANIAGGINFVGKGPPWKRKVDPEDWDDEHGHGTFVAGVVGAVENEEGVIGVGPGVNLWAVRVLDDSGSGYLSDLIAGIKWTADNGMEVSNMSLGIKKEDLDQYPESKQALQDAVDDAYGRGVLQVGAAGNEGNGSDTVIYPARFDSVIAVGATDDTDTRADFSSTGPDLELVAPGVDITSTYPKYGGYAIGGGTSFAAPHASGAVALVLASDATLTNVDARTILRTSADDLGAAGKDDLYGYGLVDAEEAATGTETE